MSTLQSSTSTSNAAIMITPVFLVFGMIRRIIVRQIHIIPASPSFVIKGTIVSPMSVLKFWIIFRICISIYTLFPFCPHLYIVICIYNI